jgi:hypothetical protein
MPMSNWVRSLAVLGAAFGGVVIITLGLASLIVSGGADAAQGQATPSPDASAPPNSGGGPVTAVGGALAVTGDREATFVVDREATDNQGYALAGEEGRIFFGGDPFGVERISYDGLEFYVAEGDCTLTPGERHDPTGVARAAIRCEEIDDIRGGGTVSIEGTVGISADLLGLRGDMPPSGGTIEVGDQEIDLPFAVLSTGSPGGFGAGGFLPTDDGSSWLQFDDDAQTHALMLTVVALDGIETEVDRGACSVTTVPIGVLNPRTDTVELTLECGAVELASGETVQIGGTIIADLVEPPD